MGAPPVEARRTESLARDPANQIRLVAWPRVRREDASQRLVRETAVPTPAVVFDPTSGQPTDLVADPVGELELVTAQTQARLWQLLQGPRGAIRERARDLLLRDDFAPVHEMPRGEHRERILEQLRVVADDGLVRVGFPASVGGRDDVASFVTAFEELSYGDISLQVKVGVHFGLFGGAIQQLGTEAHHRRYLPGVLDCTTPGCFAMTETGHGSDVQSLVTTATHDPVTDELVVHTPDRTAWKDYIGNAAAHAQLAVVFAQLQTPTGEGGVHESHGVHAVVVPLRDVDGNVLPGITITDNGHKMGLNGVDNGRIRFDQVRVPRQNLLNRHGDIADDGTYHSSIEHPTRRFFTMLGTLVQGRVAVSGGAVGASKLALTIAMRHAYTRSQFTSPDDPDNEILLIDYLAHQRRLLPRVATTFAMHFAQQALVEEFGRIFGDVDASDEDRRRLEMLAAGTKALSTWHATDAIQASREACGGFGYLSENGLGQLRADLDVYTTFEGDNTVLLQLVAKSLLTNFREEFTSLNPAGYVAFGVEQIVDQVAEWTFARQLMQSLRDAVPVSDAESSVLDRSLHVKLFAERADHTLKSVAQRLRAMGKRESDFVAFNHCQDHVLLAARAFMDRTVLEAFVDAIAAVEDEDVRQLLDRVCDLYACSTLERDRAWFMEHGFITAARSKALVTAVNELCRELRPYVQVLARSLGVPKELVRAPIALRHHGETYLDTRDRLLAEGVIGHG